MCGRGWGAAVAAFLPALVLLMWLPRSADAAVGFTIDSSALTYVGGSGVQPIDSLAMVGGDNFTNATLRVAIAPGDVVVAEDILQVLTRSPTLIASGGSISVNLGTSVVIGTYSGGTAGTDLVIVMNAVVTTAQVSELLHSIAYFNLAGPTPTVGDRTVTFTMTRASTITVIQSRVVQVGVGNALPGVTTNSGLTVGRSQFGDLRGSLITTDANDAAPLLTYALTVLPMHGHLVRKNTTPGVSPTVIDSNSTFTQQDIDNGLIAYESLGDAAADDSFTFVVSDPQGGKTPATDVDIVISGTFSNPTIILPGPLLPYVEDAPAVALVGLVDPGAGSPILSATVTDSDAPHFRQATLTVAFLTTGNADDYRAGDQFGVSSTPGALVNGSIIVTGTAISYRWSGTNHPLATIDAQFNGVGGATLRLNLLDTIIVGSPGGMNPYQISEVITPVAVARLIERITFRSTDQNPAASARLLRVTLIERLPNTGTGAAAVSLAIQPVNDAPTFTIPATPNLNLTAVSGIALNVGVLATDPDSPAPVYVLVSKDVPDSAATVVLDPVSGAFVFTPISPYTGVANLIISATDTLSASAQVTVVVTTLSAPAAANRPFVISDPPLEIEENGSLFHNLVILPNATLGSLTSASLTFVGQLPSGLTGTQLGGNAAIWTLTTSPLARPTSGTYSFGVLVTTTSTTGGPVTCYQPITLRVRALGAAN